MRRPTIFGADGGLRAVLLALCGALGCQLIAGDFEILPIDTSIVLGAACAPNTWRCTDANLETCDDDRTKFRVVETCASPDLCDPAVPACRPCVNGQYVCNDGALSRCTNGIWLATEPPCATPELCFVSAARDQGRCNPPLCEAGEYQCVDGGRLIRCAPSRDRFELVEICESAEACDAEAAAAAHAAGKPVHCELPCADAQGCGGVCTPGAVRCGRPGGLDAVERCSAAGAWTIAEICYSAGLCNSELGRCLPPACDPDETRCRGQRFERCASGRTHFAEIRTCAADQICDPELGCIPDPCAPDTLRCNDMALELCSGGVWTPRQWCASKSLCSPLNPGVCVDPDCNGGSACIADMGEVDYYGCTTERTYTYPYRCSDVGLTCTAYPDPNPDASTQGCY